MFSVSQKRIISDKVQAILRETAHPELPDGEIQFYLHVDGAEAWSWADIRNNGAITNPSKNPWNEAQDRQHDAKTTPGGNKTLPRCEVPDCVNQASFIINDRALCHQHRGPIPPSLRGSKGSGLQVAVLDRAENRIRALLANPCITYAEIGKRVGVTRERIRQIHDKLFAQERNTGRVRQHICAVSKPKEALHKNSLAFALKEKCESLDLVFETVYHNGNSAWQRRPMAYEAIVNGHLCRLQTANFRLVEGNIYISVSICRRTDVDFCLSLMEDGRWIVRPKERFRRTMFAEKVYTEKLGTHSTRHDWPQYIEAWHLLKKNS